MKSITEKKWVKGISAREAGATDHYVQYYVVTEADVGTTRLNYRGYRYSDYTFKKDDIGRIVNMMWDNTGWTCWSFRHVR